MASKPSGAFVWDTASTNLIAPTSGHMTSGWATNEKPTSAEMNGWMQGVGSYTKYLFDGDLELTGTSYDSTDYTFTATNVNNLDPAASGTVAKVAVIQLLAGTTTGPYTITGLLASTLAFREITFFNNTIYQVTLVGGSGSSSAGNRFQDTIILQPNGCVTLISPPLLAGNHSWRTLSSANAIKTTEYQHILFAACDQTSGASASNLNGITFGSTVTGWHTHPIGRTGQVLDSLSMYVATSVGGGSANQLLVYLYDSSTNSSGTNVYTWTPSSNAVGYYSISGISATLTPLTSTQYYKLVFTTGANGENISQLMYGFQQH